MFGIGFLEIIVLAVVVLVFVGPRRLPDMMHQLGRIFVRVRRMSSEVKDTFDKVIREAERELDAEKRLKTEVRQTVEKLTSSVESLPEEKNEGQSNKDD